MILRRLSQSLKEQNWTAISIEFVLLVAGVFLGIQVANWNEARAEKMQEKKFLLQLRDEISDNTETIDYQLRYYQQILTSGRRALRFLESNADCSTDCNALLVDFFLASQFWGTPYTRAKYQEVQRLGFPSNPKVRLAVDKFFASIDGWDAVTATAPAYRERVRRHISPDAAEILWKKCWRPVHGQLEELSRDCEGDLTSIDAKALIKSIQADAGIEKDLSFWLGQNIFAAHALPISLKFAKAAEDEINREIKGMP